MWSCGPSLFVVYADGSNSLGLVIHHDPEWTFYGHSHFARGPFSPLADLSFHERTFSASFADRFFNHTRTSARRARGPSSFARTTPSRTRTILILEDPGAYFRVTFASRVDPSLNKRIFFGRLFSPYLS